METTNTIKLGRTVYTVRGPLACSLYLVGPRGGESHLVQNKQRPTYWGHVTVQGFRSKTTWYVRSEDGAFTEVR